MTNRRQRTPPYIAGTQVGSWLLLFRYPPTIRYHYYWSAICLLCGKEKKVRERHLVNGKSAHCRGCNLGRGKTREKHVITPGMVFGHWTVMSLATNVKDRGNHVLARCFCGTTKYLRGRTLLQGLSKSCGCQRGALASKNNLGKHNHKLEVVNEGRNTPIGSVDRRSTGVLLGVESSQCQRVKKESLQNQAE